jgi:hypothetical protein
VAGPWDTFVYAQQWFKLNHMDTIFQEIMALPEEEITDAIFSIQSSAPTKIAEVLTAIPSIRARMWELLLEGNDLLAFIMEDHRKLYHTNEPGHDGFSWIFKVDVLCSLGKRFQGTDLWVRHEKAVKKNVRDLKKIERVMEA